MESNVSTRICGSTLSMKSRCSRTKDAIDFGGASLVHVRILRDTPSFLWSYDGRSRQPYMVDRELA